MNRRQARSLVVPTVALLAAITLLAFLRRSGESTWYGNRWVHDVAIGTLAAFYTASARRRLAATSATG